MTVAWQTIYTATQSPAAPPPSLLFALFLVFHPLVHSVTEPVVFEKVLNVSFFYLFTHYSVSKITTKDANGLQPSHLKLESGINTKAVKAFFNALQSFKTLLTLENTF